MKIDKARATEILNQLELFNQLERRSISEVGWMAFKWGCSARTAENRIIKAKALIAEVKKAKGE